jgi:major membrane immunogen (membrane-anchored lipoprotein)
VYALINTKKIQTTAYHPQTNGLVERFHRVLNDMLSCTCAQDESNWDNVVPYAMIAYRNRKQATTGYSPNYLMFGHEINLPMDVALNNIKHDDEQFDTVEKYINTTMTRMSIANTTVKSMFDDTNEIRASVNMPVRFRVGDLVMCLIKYRKRGQKHKLEARYDGPYQVTKEIGPVVRMIKKIGTHKKQTINVAQLKSYEPRQATSNSNNNNNSNDHDEDGHETEIDNEIESIMNQQVSAQQMPARPTRNADTAHVKSKMQDRITVPLSIAYDANREVILNVPELIPVLKRFYLDDTHAAKRDLEQFEPNLSLYGHDAGERVLQMRKNDVYSVLAAEIIKKHNAQQPINANEMDQ